MRRLQRLLSLGMMSGGGAAAVPWYKLFPFPNAYTAIGAASLDASRVNLASPGTNNLTDMGGARTPGFDPVLGWSFLKANTQFFFTGIVPANTQNRTVVIRYTQTSFAEVAMPFGVTGLYVKYNKPNDHTYIFNGGEYEYVPHIASGTLVITGNKAYLDKTEIATIPTGSYLTTDGMLLGAYWGGAVLGALTGVIETFAYGAFVLTSDEVATITDALP